ncbi:MAG TPA: alpha-L-fucosidase [Candidatus Limnocylindrales bacterium]|nr:alpha-L-fucosidase [Candidatus Limnocylindrales bacterium]
MRRRKFFQVLGGLAAQSAALSVLGGGAEANTAASVSPDTTRIARQQGSSAAAPGFSEYTEDYARFCATPETERVFYALRNGQIVSAYLDNNDWKPTDWGNPPELPVPGGSWDGVPMTSPIPDLAGDGPYQPTWESLLQYECPEWYRDAKFGIWNHWSPQCVPEDGDWYARNMYMQGSDQNKFQLKHYGSPALFGYKDLCAQWTLLNWQPSELMDLYASVGAKFFVALANHHDGLDAWDSKHHPWNAARVGPHRDVIGTWAAEARKRNLHFGVTVHQARNWWWFQPSHGADSSGAAYDGRLTLADGRGQWWDGLDPQQLYAPKHPYDALPDISYVKDFYDRTRDLIDQHNPDLLYFDNPLFPLGWGGMNAGAYYYNHNLAANGGKMQGVATIKNVPPKLAKSVVADIERGLAAEILPHPWQSETCIGDWHYQRALFEKSGEFGGYMPPAQVIHWMVDTVSKNGTFLLNIPGKPDGTIDRKERLILERIGEWFKINGEAIYATRPWTVFGEGPHMIKEGAFQGKSTGQLDASDIRYTRNKAGTVVYAIALGWPEQPVVLRSFGAAAAKAPKVAQVELLGSQEKIRFSQNADALRIDMPRQKPASEYAAAFRLTLA